MTKNTFALIIINIKTIYKNGKPEIFTNFISPDDYCKLL